MEQGTLVWVSQENGCCWPAFIDANLPAAQGDDDTVAVGFFPITFEGDAHHFMATNVARSRLEYPFDALFSRYAHAPETSGVNLGAFADAVCQAAEEAVLQSGGDASVVADLSKVRHHSQRVQRFVEIFEQMAESATRGHLSQQPREELDTGDAHVIERDDNGEDEKEDEYDSEEEDDEEGDRGESVDPEPTIHENPASLTLSQLHDAVLHALRASSFRKTSGGSAVERGRAWARETISLGIVRRRGGAGISVATATRRKPRLTSLLVALARALGVPEASSIYVSKNVRAQMHVDRNNVGPSTIVALGSFADGGREGVGGGLYARASGEHAWRCHDVRLSRLLRAAADASLAPKPLRFDGNAPHATCPFEGERFAVIFYVHRQHARLAAAERAFLAERGFPLPANRGGEAMVARRPRYGFAELHDHERRLAQLLHLPTPTFSPIAIALRSSLAPSRRAAPSGVVARALAQPVRLRATREQFEERVRAKLLAKQRERVGDVNPRSASHHTRATRGELEAARQAVEQRHWEADVRARADRLLEVMCATERLAPVSLDELWSLNPELATQLWFSADTELRQGVAPPPPPEPRPPPNLVAQLFVRNAGEDELIASVQVIAESGNLAELPERLVVCSYTRDPNVMAITSNDPSTEFACSHLVVVSGDDRKGNKNIGTFTEYLRGRSKAAVVAPLEDQAERFILPARSDGLLLAIRKSHSDTDAEDRGRKAPRLV